jgi:cysteine-rich repeat protein
MRAISLLLLAILLGSNIVRADQQQVSMPELPNAFQAHFEGTFDSVAADGTIYYNYINGVQRLDVILDNGHNITEIIDYTKHQKSFICESCDASFFDEAQPILFTTNSSVYVGSSQDCEHIDSQVRIGAESTTPCSVYSNAQSASFVVRLFIDGSGVLHRFQVIDSTGVMSKDFVLSNVVVGEPDQALFIAPEDCNGAVTCRKVMDLMLLLDSSYSISVEEGEWGQLVSFSRDILTFLNIGESTHVGIVQFSNVTNLEIGLTDNAQAALAALDNMVKIDSYTALGEGLAEAESALQAGGRPGVTKFILVIGDGENNMGVDPIEVADRLKANGVIIMTIAVGDLDLPQLREIASSDDLALLSPSYSELQTVLNRITPLICSGGPQSSCPNDCSGVGFCGCGNICICGNNATTPDCVPIVPFCGDGIKQDNEECDDGNRVDNDCCNNQCKLKVCSHLSDQCNIGVCDLGSGQCQASVISSNTTNCNGSIVTPSPINSNNPSVIITPSILTPSDQQIVTPNTDDNNDIVVPVVVSVVGAAAVAVAIGLLVWKFAPRAEAPAQAPAPPAIDGANNNPMYQQAGAEFNGQLYAPANNAV